MTVEQDIRAYERSERLANNRHKKDVLKLKGIRPKKKVSRVGKLGIVRLVGQDLDDLRQKCFQRDHLCCQECGRGVAWDWSEERYGVPRGQMAHIRTKRNNGDTIGNVKTMCPTCHAKSHNAGGKPVPSK